MTRREIVLAALAPSNGDKHSPVQIQKLLFLIDIEAAGLIEGPHFDFKPYDYGPFDKEVYVVFDELEEEGLTTIRSDSYVRTYALTPKGQDEAEDVLKNLPEKARDYIQRASKFVLSLGFGELVASIYKAYPDMKKNSIFANV